jgi:WD40 repeat protein
VRPERKVGATRHRSRALCANARAPPRRVWDLATGQCAHVLAGHTGRLNGVRVAPSAPIAVTVADDFTARVWDWPAGRCLHVLVRALLGGRRPPRVAMWWHPCPGGGHDDGAPPRLAQ